MRETLLLFNPQWKGEFLNIGNKIREFYINQILENLLNRKEIIFLTGIRRIGKTTLMKQTINYLIEKEKVNPKNILFVSLDNLLFSKKTIFDIISEYRKINDISLDEKFYLFIDEITYLDNFSQQLKNLFDTWNVKVLCSSSNASYLNDEKAYLTGRTKTIEVFPLTYSEYLDFKELKIHKFDTTLNQKEFENYLKLGGLPQYIIENNPQNLVDVVNSIIEKDIISYYKLEDEKTIKELFRLLCERIGKPISYNKLSNILLTEKNIKIKSQTIKKYLTYLEKTFLIYSCERFSHSINENITSPKKFYIIDTGLKNLFSKFEIGNSFENLVFLELHKVRNPFYPINYLLDNGVEIDFIIKNKLLVESKYLNSDLTEKQKILFDKIKVDKKLIIKSKEDFEKIKRII